MKVKFLATALLATALWHSAVAQQTYLITDTLMSIGIKLLEGSPRDNALYITHEKGSLKTRYTPHEITEYRLKNGQTFRSFTIQQGNTPTRYFFQRLFQGSFNVYSLQRKNFATSFFIVHNDSLPLTAIPEEKKDYRAFLRDYVKTCESADKNLKHLKLRKNLLKRFFQDYESCSGRPMPRVRFGLKAGISLNGFSTERPEDLGDLQSYKRQSGYFVGGYMHAPIAASNFSIVPGATLHNYHGSFDYKKNTTTYDRVINQVRLDIPVLLRYTFLRKRISPFIEGGPRFSQEINGDSDLYSYTTAGDNVYIDVVETPVITKHQFGFSLSGGMVLNYVANRSAFFQIEYTKHYSTQPNDGSFMVNGLSFSGGLLF